MSAEYVLSVLNICLFFFFAQTKEILIQNGSSKEVMFIKMSS